MPQQNTYLDINGLSHFLDKLNDKFADKTDVPSSIEMYGERTTSGSGTSARMTLTIDAYLNTQPTPTVHHTVTFIGYYGTWEKSTITVAEGTTFDFNGLTLSVMFSDFQTNTFTPNSGATFSNVSPATGVVNTDMTIYATAISSATYGIKRALNSTSSEWTRTNDAVGLVANATHDGSSVTNDFDNLYPWSAIKTVNITTGGEVVAEIRDSNFSFSPSNSEVMTYVPGFWIHRYTDSSYEYIDISGLEISGGVYISPFYIGRYHIGTGNVSKTNLAPLVSQTISTFRTNAQNKGTSWGLIDIFHICAIQCLYLVEYADADSQTVLGLGRTNGSNLSALTSGGCNNLGMKSGCISNDGKHSVIYRGLENIFGNVWQFVDGINIQDRKGYVSYNRSGYASDTFSGDYKALSYTNATSIGYATKMGYDSNNQLIMLPTNISSSNIGYKDYYYQYSGNIIALFGGDWSIGSYAGFFHWNCESDSSIVFSSIGSRFLFETTQED